MHEEVPRRDPRRAAARGRSPRPRPDLRAASLRSTHNAVAGLVEREQVAEALSPDVFGELRTESLLIAKTADRSVLGVHERHRVRAEREPVDLPPRPRRRPPRPHDHEPCPPRARRDQG